MGINIPRETKDLYTEHYKILLKEIEEDTIKWKDIWYSWIGRFNVKMVRLPKVVCKFSAISIKIPVAFFAEVDQKILKLNLIGPFIWDFNLEISILTLVLTSRPFNLEKEEQIQRSHTSWFQTYYKATEIKAIGTGKETDVETSRTE